MAKTDAPKPLELHKSQEPRESQEVQKSQAPIGPPHTIFTKRQQIVYVYIASLAAFASPVSSSIYYPAMQSIATDLNTSLTNISLTITAYMVRSVTKLRYRTRLTIYRYSRASHLPSWAVSQIALAVDQPTFAHSQSSSLPTLDSLCKRISSHCSSYAVSKAVVVVAQSHCPAQWSPMLLRGSREAASLG